jgi:protein LSM14
MAPPLSENLWDAFNMLPRRDFMPGGYNPNMPIGPGNVSPGMPGQNIPGYGTAQPGGAAPTLPPYHPQYPPNNTPGGYNPNLPVGPGNVSPGMPDYPIYGPPQTSGAALTYPASAGYGPYNPNLPIGPGNVSPGMPGIPGPPIYGPPQTGGAAPSIPGSGHVPVINRLPHTGYPYWDAMQNFFHNQFPTPPPTPTFQDNPWYPPIMPGHQRMLPGTTPLAPAMISPGMFR